MKLLLLTVCLASALLRTAEALRCHTCNDEICSSSASVNCPATSNACQTVTRVTSPPGTVTVVKNCSSVQNCTTPLTLETEWSVNRGYRREAFTQLCCVTDNCNMQTLATPSTAVNGKLCPSCANSTQSQAGSCDATASCLGAEDSCFSGNTTLNSRDVLNAGCLSRNLCGNVAALKTLLGENPRIVCGAPSSISLSMALLICAPTAYKVLS
ncbi:uncharacterized protein LOC114440466 [Parambassis ranga]|uniref:Uncharacterized protein LOC114440466 n=1 Tax=Parambassis ranga TaxID=210632 RepID=A0A6P7ITH2_9TELE|nr:uncharacterized protein LOC114440466 [Parambassis ranga]